MTNLVNILAENIIASVAEAMLWDDAVERVYCRVKNKLL